jgi:hypothetical protein
VRFLGLDVHRDFCEVAICEDGRVRSGGRVPTSPQGLRVLANSLAPEDHVALEATGNALAIARALEPHAGRVVVAARNELRAISEAKVKTDRRDARTLASGPRLFASTRSPSGLVATRPPERTRPASQIAISQKSRCTSNPTNRTVVSLHMNAMTGDQVGKRQGRIRAHGTAGRVAGAATEVMSGSRPISSSACPAYVLPQSPYPGARDANSTPGRHPGALFRAVSSPEVAAGGDQSPL